VEDVLVDVPELLDCPSNEDGNVVPARDCLLEQQRLLGLVEELD
jgi:hypothetical protein